jgi:tetratricopeptide (TPR) repeat protein
MMIKKNVSYVAIKKYIPYENASNNYKEKRNQAYVRIGLCYKQLGNNEKAVAYLYKGLDLVDLKATVDWAEAVAALSEIVGFTPEQ